MRRPNLLCSSIVLAMSCAPAHAMTLTEAIQSTVENHPQIQASQNARLSADEEVKVAKGGYLPSVDVLAGYGRQNSDTPSTRALSPGTHNKETLTYGTSELRLRQMLFDGFNTPNEVARTEAVVNSRAYYTLGTAEALALRTIEVYLEVLKRRELVTLAKNNLQAHLRVTDQIGPDILLFNTDYPHVEGGRNPLKRFNDSLAGVSDTGRRAFYRDNFIDLMGKGLDPVLHDLPSLAAA